MFKRKKEKRKKIIRIIIFFLLFFLWIFFLMTQNKNYSKIEKIFRDFGVAIEDILLPKLEITDSSILEGIQQELEEENQELKEMLELDNSTFHFIHATVIQRNIDWYQEIVINKGEKDGISVDMAVISNHGLIGRISKTGYTSSSVTLLTTSSNDMKVAVDIKTDTETIHGILDHYIEEESLIQVNNISKNKEIHIGDKVYTNGLGGIYPSGIYIGTVVDVTSDSLGLNKIVKVKPDVSYDKIRYVTVIDRRI